MDKNALNQINKIGVDQNAHKPETIPFISRAAKIANKTSSATQNVHVPCLRTQGVMSERREYQISTKHYETRIYQHKISDVNQYIKKGFSTPNNNSDN
jgi:hypothetical protein